MRKSVIGKSVFRLILILSALVLTLSACGGSSGGGGGSKLPDETVIISNAPDGAPGDNLSYSPAISSDGKYIAFHSLATNLVAGDTNGFYDVFVRDVVTGLTTLLSNAPDGSGGNANSSYAAISSDGNYVAFHSLATNLVAGDTNGFYDVFVRDMSTGVTTLISNTPEGAASDGTSDNPAISSDGRYVAFVSSATNLVATDTNGKQDIFVRDMQTGLTTVISNAPNGDEGSADTYHTSISADGRYVAFTSYDANLVAVDTNGKDDVFVRDRQTGLTTLISNAPNGDQGTGIPYEPRISADGRYVAFSSDDTNLVALDTNGKDDVFVHDRQTGITALISNAPNGDQGNLDAYGASISADGRYVAFNSGSTNLVAGDLNGMSDIFVYDMKSGATTLISKASDGTQGDNDSYEPRISTDGRYVAFHSYAENLVTVDGNNQVDVFFTPVR